MDPSWISQRLYMSLTMNIQIGDDIMVHIRRAATEQRDNVNRMLYESRKGDFIPVLSGSRAEGFRFSSSDEDWMLVYRHIHVIPSISCSKVYDSNATLLKMENELTKPGFTLLRILNNSTEPFIQSSTEFVCNGKYISSKLWRESHTAASTNYDIEYTHGPCTSGIIGSHEYDIAHCLKCDTWPAKAHDCIKRLNQSQWPPGDIIRSIVSDGILFVPIGAKKSNLENTEWRMSFSLAEKKLIHAMNHTQFLCYGLLKIFLKEAINRNEDVKNLLCSYFLKTAVFWEIISCPNPWTPFTLLSHFWNCFQRLLQWVQCSYCPNFFIPQNNMFEGKIDGKNQEKLLKHLSYLYNEGFICLQRCPSVVDVLCASVSHHVVQQPDMKCVYKMTLLQVFAATSTINHVKKDLTIHNIIKCLLLHYLASTAKNVLERFIYQMYLYRYLACDSAIDFSNLRINKLLYLKFKQRMKALNQCHTDSVCHYLYKAVLLYYVGKYKQCMKLVHNAKIRISSIGSFYMHNCFRVHEIITNLDGDNSTVESFMRRSYIDIFHIRDDQCISELFIEAHGRNFNHDPIVISAPPLVFAFFLQYLCYTKLSCLNERDNALYELSLLVHHDDEYHIYHDLKASSWEILGICQQMNNDKEGACFSYLMALRQETNFFKLATCIRLGTLLAAYFWCWAISKMLCKRIL